VIDFKLDPKSGIPFYRQIIDQIRFGISRGDLKVGEQLPTVRALAVQLQVNLNTISKAYRELDIQNVLEKQQGTGTFIGQSAVKIPRSELKTKLESICGEFLGIASTYGYTVDEIIDELKRRKGGDK
jgi:GntR family transcriptional regulator